MKKFIIICVLLLSGCKSSNDINNETNNFNIEKIGIIENNQLNKINKEINNLPIALFKNLEHIYISEQPINTLTNEQSNIYGKYYPNKNTIYLNGNPYHEKALTHELLHHFDNVHQISNTDTFTKLLNNELLDLNVSDYSENSKNEEYFVAIGISYLSGENIKEKYPKTYEYIKSILIDINILFICIVFS